MKRFISMACIVLLILSGCGTNTNGNKEKVIIRIKCPPLTMSYDDAHQDAEIYDLFHEASALFVEEYDKYEVEFHIEKYQYVDEKEKVIDTIGTKDAADILFGGSFNIPGYIRKNQLLALDDIIDESFRKDIDETIWKQVQTQGKTYMIPYYTLQNNLMVNEEWMRKAGLEQYIPKQGTIAQWSTEEFNQILYTLKDAMEEDNTWPMAMYAANNQGDMHIMTLLRAYGSTLYDKEGNFHINTEEGRAALTWLRRLNQDGITPKGAENYEYTSVIALFYNNQLAICPGNVVTMNEARLNHQQTVFLANSPSLDGNGYATTYLNGFIVFDNKDDKKAEVAKDFIRFIYSKDKLLRYSLSGIPTSKTYYTKHKDQLNFDDSYKENEKNVVDNLNNRPNWEGVRAVFYRNIQALLVGDAPVEQIAEEIDQQCNKAIKKG